MREPTETYYDQAKQHLFWWVHKLQPRSIIHQTLDYPELIQRGTGYPMSQKKQEDVYHRIKYHLIEILLLLIFLIEAGRYIYWLIKGHSWKAALRTLYRTPTLRSLPDSSWSWPASSRPTHGRHSG